MLTIAKKLSILILSLVGILIVILSIGIIWLFINSPGETAPFVDENGNNIENSISTIEYLPINGIEQFVLMRGKNKENPILLILHGGPGSPQAHMFCKFNKQLEENYIVINWDQRGAGASYFDSIAPSNLTIDIMIEDVRELSEYLIKRFNKEKIYIMGHSWGSYLGMRTINKYPDLFYAYVGIGQVANQRQSEQESYNFVMNSAKKENNTKALKQLQDIGYPNNGIYNNETAISIERNWVIHYGGAAYNRDKTDFYKMFILPIFTFNEYRVKDKFNYVRGMLKSQEILWMQLMNQQLPDIIKTVNIPIYFLQGLNDYQTTHAQAKIFFNSIDAPKKEFITFEKSSHMLPYNWEKEKFHQFMKNLSYEN